MKKNNKIVYLILSAFVSFLLIKNVDAKDIYDTRYSAENETCGQALYITTCDGDDVNATCYYTSINGVSQNGSISKGKLAETQAGARNFCKSSNTNFTVSFNTNGLVNTSCPGMFNQKNNSTCSGSFTSSIKINFNKDLGSLNDITDSNGRLLYGYTKNQKECTRENIISKTDSSVSVSTNTNFYACYTRIINASRYSIQNCGSSLVPEQMSVSNCYLVSENGNEEEYCNYTSSSGNGIINSEYLMEGLTNARSACVEVNENANKGTWYVKANASASTSVTCGAKINVKTCDGETCVFNKIEGKSTGGDQTINKSSITTSKSEATSSCESVEEEELKNCVNEKHKNVKDDFTFTVCYKKSFSSDEVEDMIYNDLIYCGKNYKLDTTKTTSASKPSCVGNYCKRTYTVTCSKTNYNKPSLSVSSGIAGANGYGDITVKASSSNGKITAYYVSEVYKIPTASSDWITTNSDTFTVNSSVGVKYIWVIDEKGIISNAVSGSIIDTDTTDNTIKELRLKDGNGNITNPNSIAHNLDGLASSNYVRLSNDLRKDSDVLADAFNPFDMEYETTVSSPTITVTATLTSTDASYVDGYGPRTVDLDYGINTVLVKIKNKKGKVRTYTIIVTRTDDRTADNTLNSLNVSTEDKTYDINFNPYITDYKVTIPKDTKNVVVSSALSSEFASYVEGYEPGVVNIDGDTTVKLIKVKSQSRTTRTYVLTFIKDGTDIIEDDSLKLYDLSIPDVYVPFEENVSNYSLTVDYQVDVIDLIASLKDEESSYIVRIKNKNDNNYTVTSSNGINLEVGDNYLEIEVTNKNGENSYYRFTIIRKEFGLEISDDKVLKDLKVLGYNIDFNPSKKDYTVKIKTEKSLVITAVPNSSKSEVYILGNDELSGFSIVRIKVVAENGDSELYTIDIQKDAFNKKVELTTIFVGGVIILISSCIIIIKKKVRARRDYYRE